MKYGVALVAFGLTSLCAMEQPLPSLPAPSIKVHLGNLQSDVQRLQRRNITEIQKLMACLQIASTNPELRALQVHLSESIAFLVNDAFSLTDAENQINTIRTFVAASHSKPKRTHDTALATPSKPRIDPSLKKRKWLFVSYAPESTSDASVSPRE